jgi:hypothetical protein
LLKFSLALLANSFLIQSIQKVVTINPSLTLSQVDTRSGSAAWNFLPSGLESVLVTGGTTMKKPDWSPRQDLDAKATQAAREAQNLPPRPERR